MHKKTENGIKKKITSGYSFTSNQAKEFRKRMLQWPNPVEFVNNMYGCHPGDNNTDYFKVIFKK